MTDLVIINPSAAHGIYGPLGDDLIAVEPPLWSRIIAGYVRDRGFSVKIIDAEALRMTGDQVADAISSNALGAAPELICIAVYGHQPSASTQQMWGARELAHALKKRCPQIPIVMVGGHPSALPARTVAEESVDYVVKGEGPTQIVGLLNGIDPQEIAGLYRKVETALYSLPMHNLVSAPLEEDMKRFHGAAWDLLPMHLYRAHNWQCFGENVENRQPYASIFTSLGCPYKCQFCCINSPFDSNRYRMRQPSDVVDEIEFLHEEHGVSTFKITDEMFILNERHYTEICKGLIDRDLGHKLNIWAYARVDTVKPATLTMLRAAGIRWLALGIESGSKLVRDGAHKVLKHDDIVGTVQTIQAHDINVIGNFMFGLRDDDELTMTQTLDLAMACMPDFANFYCTMAYPGSALYAQAIKEGWTLPSSWRGYSQHNDDCRPLDTEHISGADVLRFRDEAFNTFFDSQAYGNHVRNKFGMATLVHVHGMTSYKLKRKLLEAAE
jgi:anaerobic magnesium-protoporphyrin IX monomethyl ester cyclase